MSRRADDESDLTCLGGESCDCYAHESDLEAEGDWKRSGGGDERV